FLKALERIPSLISTHEMYAEKAAKDLPVLEEVVKSEWRKEDMLRKFKVELSGVERKIQLSLSDKNSEHEEKNVIQLNNNSGIEQNVAIAPKIEQRFKVS
ncbi:MAG: helicase, partial [Draconibacterium sp.]|nr:helicase [Draconibacterium sp.]